MKKHTRKMIAPIVISILFIIYFVGIAAVCVTDNAMPGFVKFLFVAIPLILCGVMIGVAISRINEIRSGEEDDLSKY